MSDNQEYTGHVYCPRCKKTHWVNHDCGVTLSDEEKNNQEHKALTNLMAEVKLPNDDNMNYDYIADTWVILKIISEDYPDGVYKLLCTFRGGYINGDEWRMNEIHNERKDNMYKLVETDEVARTDSEEFTPVATLADEYGGRCQIAVDDHCYILRLLQWDGTYKTTPYIFREAFNVLVTLPEPK